MPARWWATSREGTRAVVGTERSVEKRKGRDRALLSVRPREKKRKEYEIKGRGGGGGKEMEGEKLRETECAARNEKVTGGRERERE